MLSCVCVSCVWLCSMVSTGMPCEIVDLVYLAKYVIGQHGFPPSGFRLYSNICICNGNWPLHDGREAMWIESHAKRRQGFLDVIPGNITSWNTSVQKYVSVLIRSLIACDLGWNYLLIVAQLRDDERKHHCFNMFVVCVGDVCANLCTHMELVRFTCTFQRREKHHTELRDAGWATASGVWTIGQCIYIMTACNSWSVLPNEAEQRAFAWPISVCASRRGIETLLYCDHANWYEYWLAWCAPGIIPRPEVWVLQSNKTSPWITHSIPTPLRRKPCWAMFRRLPVETSAENQPATQLKVMHMKSVVCPPWGATRWCGRLCFRWQKRVSDFDSKFHMYPSTNV